MVKFEGGLCMIEMVCFFIDCGILVWVYIGLMLQSVNIFGGYCIQGKDEINVCWMKEEVLVYQEVGVVVMFYELIFVVFGKELIDMLKIFIVGIGVGVDCFGQVLVLQDMFGIYLGKLVCFVKNFMEGVDSIEVVVCNYVVVVKDCSFFVFEYCY